MYTCVATDNIEQFHSIKYFPHTFLQSISSITPNLRLPLTCSVSLWVRTGSSRISYKWNYVSCAFLCLASFLILVIACISSLFLFIAEQYYVIIPQLVYVIIWYWTFGLFLVYGYYEESCYDFSCASLFGECVCISLGQYRITLCIYN